MTRMAVEVVEVALLQFDPENARKHAERDLTAIKTSLKRFGQQRPILIDKAGVVRAGNGTLAAAKMLGWQTIAAVRTELEDAEAVAYSIADNRTAELSAWDKDVLWSNLDAIQSFDPALLAAAGFTEAEMEAFAPSDEEVGLPVEEGKRLREDDFPAEPDWGIPLLELDTQATTVSTPAVLWGSRGGQFSGTWLFYTQEFKFDRLWSNPDKLVATGAPVVSECHFELDGARAVVLWGIYRKRWLSRYWGAKGIKIIVDVPSEHEDLALLGVPDGWSAYSTRGKSDATLNTAYDMAKTRCGTDPNLFLVYGGNEEIARSCKARGLIYVAEQRTPKPTP